MLVHLKKLFWKELEDIVAPLERIKSDITTYIHKQEYKIERDSIKVKSFIESNTKRLESNIKASTIIKNLETLLGG